MHKAEEGLRAGRRQRVMHRSALLLVVHLVMRLGNLCPRCTLWNRGFARSRLLCTHVLMCLLVMFCPAPEAEDLSF